MNRPAAPGSPRTAQITPHRTRVDVEVRYAETDQMGVVHHAVYPVWFELARTRHCSETGTHYAEVEELGYFLVVTGVELRLLKGARYGQTVGVACWLERLQSRVMRFAYEVDHEGRVLVRGATDHVWVERATGRPCRIPEVLKEPYARLAGGAAPP